MNVSKLFADITNLINKFGEIMIGVAGLIVVVMIVIGGIQYITGQADSGKKTITAAIIGTIIIVLSWAIIAFIGRLLR